MVIACFLICFLSAFVAFERYQSNANQVRALNSLTQSGPFGNAAQSVLGGSELKPAMPAPSKYAILLAVLSGAGGFFFLMHSKPNS